MQADWKHWYLQDFRTADIYTVPLIETGKCMHPVSWLFFQSRTDLCTDLFGVLGHVYVCVWGGSYGFTLPAGRLRGRERDSCTCRSQLQYDLLWCPGDWWYKNVEYSTWYLYIKSLVGSIEDRWHLETYKNGLRGFLTEPAIILIHRSCQSLGVLCRGAANTNTWKVKVTKQWYSGPKLSTFLHSFCHNFMLLYSCMCLHESTLFKGLN